VDTSTKSDSVRDYIYLDTNRAKSIYSQLRRGLVQSYIKGTATAESSTKNSAAGDQTIEQNVLLGTDYEATHVLHDFLYSEIEADLSEAIVDVQSLENVNELQPGDYVRISGPAQIDDTERFLRILDNINTLHSYVSMATELEEMQKAIWDIQNKLEFQVLNKREHDRLEKEMLSLKPPALFRKEYKGVSDLTSDMIRLWLDLMYPGMFEIKLQPVFSDELIFRSIVDRDYLRENPSLTYAKHSSRTQANWTLVGQVTAIYCPKELGSDDDDESNDEISTNMRDSFESVFGTLKPMEEHILVSASRTTVVSTPLAIYQETSTK